MIEKLELLRVPAFADLPDDQISWFLANSQEIHLAAGPAPAPGGIRFGFCAGGAKSIGGKRTQVSTRETWGTRKSKTKATPDSSLTTPKLKSVWGPALRMTSST